MVVSRRVGFPVGIVGRSKYRIPDLFIAVSDFVRWRLVDAGVPVEKIKVVFDGVAVPEKLPDTSIREESRRRRGAGKDTFVLGTLSSFAPEKLLAQELDLLRHLPATTHFWLGVPEKEPDSREAGNKLLEIVHAKGLGERFQIVSVGENPAEFLAGLDLFIYLSEMEGLGSAILLAMGYGLPVVASRVGGIPEIVTHGQSGVLVDESSLAALPASIQFLIDSPQSRRRMGMAAREFAAAKGSSDRMVDQTILLYQQLLQGSREARL
jgi:glycosyltransferase involved in cell wall biosynthesis